MQEHPNSGAELFKVHRPEPARARRFPLHFAGVLAPTGILGIHVDPAWLSRTVTVQ
jgi:hypothetical protein